MAKRISVVIVGVADMDRAVDFYGKALKLPLKFKSAEYSEFDLPGVVLALQKNEVHKPAATPLFTLSTDDIQEEGARLVSSKVNLHKPLREEEYGWVIMPYDSENNIFEIVQYKKKMPRREKDRAGAS